MSDSATNAALPPTITYALPEPLPLGVWTPPTAVTQAEADSLTELARGRLVLELGAEFGASTIVLARVARRVVSVDWHRGDQHTSGGFDTLLHYLWAIAPVRERVIPMVGRFEDILPLLQDSRFDLTFVDGAHDLESVSRDLVEAVRCTRPGGVVACHDYGRYDVEKAWAAVGLAPDRVVHSLAILEVDADVVAAFKAGGRGGVDLTWPPASGAPHQDVVRPVPSTGDTTVADGVAAPITVFATGDIRAAAPRRKLAVVVPSSGTLPTVFTHNFLQAALPPGGLCYAWPCGPYISQNMREGVRTLLQRDDWDRLLVLETDMLIPEDALRRHAEHSEAIVGSLYFGHAPPHEAYVYSAHEFRVLPWPDEAVQGLLDEPGLYEAGAVGLGCTSIRRDVFEAWPADRPWFMNSWEPELATVPASVGEIGHDIWFCAQARALGFRVFVDSAIQCAHITPMGVQAATWRAEQQRRAAAAQP